MKEIAPLAPAANPEPKQRMGLVLSQLPPMSIQKSRPHLEHRKQENQRIQESPSLEAKFPQLKSLSLNLAWFGGQSSRKGSTVKYTLNISHAKSLLRFKCPNPECLYGDFDLSEKLAEAIGDQEGALAGEMRCEGWRNKDSVGQVRCHTLLRFEFTIGYKPKSRAKRA